MLPSRPPSPRDRAPGRPAIHVSPASGWLNDPNGLCLVDGVWHAFYQHDPTSDVQGPMHWGHATSSDLLHWTDRPIALTPDRLGVIFSGSVVVDEEGTAGFGPGVLVAAFTHHLEHVERQSLAFSRDQGMTWQTYEGNPVLESDERHFRDPKLLRFGSGALATWVMALAAGRRIDLYRSADLRSWRPSGSFTATDVGGLWECPDLVRVRGRDGRTKWLLLFSLVGVDPNSHGATVGVLGDFDGTTFERDGPVRVLDHGPDFYAAQSFFGLPGDEPVVMAWLSSWRYAETHPSTGRRGMLSLPRRLGLGADGSSVTSVPAPDLEAAGVEVAGRRWTSVSDRALVVHADGDVGIDIGAADGIVTTVRIAEGHVVVERLEEVVAGYAQTYTAEVAGDGPHTIVVDHGSIEVFAGGGTTTLSSLVFAGECWTADVDGDVRLTAV